jgi:hypothetical protein
MHGSPIQASKSLIFFRRKEHDIVAAMASYDHRLSMRNAT